jgi:hypothetical protein
MVKQLFSYSEKQIERLLPVFDHAAVEERQFVVEPSWFFEEHTLMREIIFIKKKQLTIPYKQLMLV